MEGLERRRVGSDAGVTFSADRLRRHDMEMDQGARRVQDWADCYHPVQYRGERIDADRIQIELGDEQAEPTGIEPHLTPSVGLRIQAGTASTDIKMAKKDAIKADQIFQKTKALIVAHLQNQGVSFEAEHIKLQINYTTQQAKWVANDDGVIHDLDLTAIGGDEGAQIRGQLQQFITATASYTARPGNSIHLSQYQEMIAGPTNGRSFFAKGIEGMHTEFGDFAKKDLRKLMKKHDPNGGTENNSAEVAIRMKDMATVDLYQAKLTKTFKDIIARKETELLRAQDPNAKKEIAEDIKTLKKRCAELENAHNEALYAFIALDGLEGIGQNAGDRASAIQHANQVQSQLRDYLVKDQGINRKFFGRMERSGGIQGLDVGHDRFIKGVGALAIPPQDGIYGDDLVDVDTNTSLPVPHRAVFDQYRESKGVSEEYGTGMEGSFLLVKALAWHNDNVDSPTSQDRNRMITGGFHDGNLGLELNQAIADLEVEDPNMGEIAGLRVQMDQQVPLHRGDVDGLIKAAANIHKASIAAL